MSETWGHDLLHAGLDERDRGRGQHALVVRTGGLGDILFATPVIRIYAEMGYAVSVFTVKMGESALRHNPHVRCLYTRTDQPWDAPLFHDIQKYFHRVANLQNSLEGNVVFRVEDPGYYANHWQRQTTADFAEETLKAAGLSNPERKLLLPELYWNDIETEWARAWVAKTRQTGRQAVLWNPLGSSMNKHVLQAPEMMRWMLAEFPSADIAVVGDFRVHAHPILAPALRALREEHPERVCIVAFRPGDFTTWTPLRSRTNSTPRTSRSTTLALSAWTLAQSQPIASTGPVRHRSVRTSCQTLVRWRRCFVGMQP